MSGSDALSLSLQVVFLPVSMPCNYFLKGGHDVPRKRIAVNRPLIMKWWAMGGEEAFYSPIIRSQSFSEPMLWTVNFTTVLEVFFLPC